MPFCISVAHNFWTSTRIFMKLDRNVMSLEKYWSTNYCWNWVHEILCVNIYKCGDNLWPWRYVGNLTSGNCVRKCNNILFIVSTSFIVQKCICHYHCKLFEWWQHFILQDMVLFWMLMVRWRWMQLLWRDKNWKQVCIVGLLYIIYVTILVYHVCVGECLCHCPLSLNSFWPHTQLSCNLRWILNDKKLPCLVKCYHRYADILIVWNCKVGVSLSPVIVGSSNLVWK